MNESGVPDAPAFPVAELVQVRALKEKSRDRTRGDDEEDDR